MSGILKKQTGFTIVELLIVVVVIAILATISMVAYANVQERANVARVHSDLRGIAQKLSIYNAENETYPRTTAQVGVSNIGSAVSNSHGNDLLYCWGADGYMVYMTLDYTVAGSRQFRIGSNEALREVLPRMSWDPVTLCPTASYSYRAWNNFW